MLIVDGDPEVHRALRPRLEARKYVVDYARDEAEATVRLTHVMPDVLFLNVPAPGPNGLDLLQSIRAQNLDMAVIVITAESSEELVIEALRSGADDYLRKPFDRDEFDKGLDRVVEHLTVTRQHAALQNRLGSQLARAAQIQAELLPRNIPNMAGFELSACCVPAQGVGGDFYDWQQVSQNLLKLTVGDVMGKGMPAALLMAATRTVLRAVASDSDPASAVQSMAATLDDDLARSGAFVTLFHAQLDSSTGRLTYVDAGHGYALLRRAGGEVESLRPWGLPLGIVSDERYECGSVTLGPGDVLVVYTDGLKEARPDLWPTHEALAAQIDDGASAPEIVNRLIEEAQAWAPFRDDLDDITVVVLRRAFS